MHPPVHSDYDVPYPVGKFALLYCHGNAGTMAGATHRIIRMCVELGVVVYAFEYPGIPIRASYSGDLCVRLRWLD